MMTEPQNCRYLKKQESYIHFSERITVGKFGYNEEKMGLFFRLTICSSLILVSHGFLLQCPNAGHTYLRARSLCGEKPLENYACLFDTNRNVSVESCILSPDYLPPGQHYVLTSIRRNINCPPNTYQPYSLWVNESGDCLFKKSTCEGVGLIVHDNGSFTEDRTCRCDYKRGYSFINRPQKSCFCSPAKEDCSCYIVQCPGNTRLNSDYWCSENDRDGNEGQRCDLIQEIREVTLRTTIPIYFRKDQTDRLEIPDSTTCGTVLFVLIVLAGIVMALVVNLYRVVCKCLPKCPMQLQDDRNILMQFSQQNFGNVGQKLTIFCPVKMSSLYMLNVRWFVIKNGTRSEINELAKTYVTKYDTPSLTFISLGTHNTGNYTCIITTACGNIVCDPQEVVVGQDKKLVESSHSCGIVGQDITLNNFFRLEWRSDFTASWGFVHKDKKVQKVIDATSNANKYEISTTATNLSLTIKGLQPNDNGTYTCIIKACFGDIRCYPQDVSVIGGRPSVNPTTKRCIMKRGSSAILKADVIAIPPHTTINWKKRDGETPKDANVINVVTPLGFIASSLTINSVTSADEGVYVCEAENSLGQGSCEVQLSLSV